MGHVKCDVIQASDARLLLLSYAGGKPQLFLADPEMIKEVLVKNFDCFTDRQHFQMPEEVGNNHLIILDGQAIPASVLD